MSVKNFSSKADASVYWIDCPIDWSFLIRLHVSEHQPSHRIFICSMGVRLAVLNSIWWPVNERKSKPVWLRPSMSSMLNTSNVSQLNRMSADSFPVLYFDFSSSVIDLESQIVGDDCCWSPSFTGTTWIENKSLNQMMSPDSSSKNFMPFSPSFSVRLESNDSQIWKCAWRKKLIQVTEWAFHNGGKVFSIINLLSGCFYLPIAKEGMVVCCTTTHFVSCMLAKMISATE